MKKLVKICGIKDPLNAREVSFIDPDMMGFIFYQHSPRAVTLQNAAGIIPVLKSSAAHVGVFVNESEENIVRIASELSLDYVQLHGEETPELCSKVVSKGFRVIKAFGIGNEFDFTSLSSYEGVCSFLLFDNKGKDRGGTGKRFRWEMLDEYKLDIPFLLSGGIGPGDAVELAGISHPEFAGIDLNSRFENSPGDKNVALLENFIREFRRL